MKKYSVLVLTMSTLSDPLTQNPDPFQNRYILQVQNEDNSFRLVGETYHAIGQLEPVPQYILDTYRKITHYIILATEKAKNPLSYDWKSINKKIVETGINGQIEYIKDEKISAVTFFEKRIKALHKLKGVEEPSFSVVDISENDPGKGIKELLDEVRGIYKKCVETNTDESIDDCWSLYVDIHGGLRATSFATFTLIQILSAPDMDDEKDLEKKSGESKEQYIARLTDGKPTIPVTKIYTVNFDPTDRGMNYIVDQTKLYNVYTKESIEAYMNYGQYAQMALRSRIDPFADEVKPYAFISYRRTDAPKERFTFLGSLKKGGYRYWYDDSIPVMDDWKKTLEQANEKCSVFIALITKDYYRSYQCLKEMAQAIDQKKPILLYSLDKTPLYSPIKKGDDSITQTNSETNDSITIYRENIEKSIDWRNHLALDNQLFDDIYQLPALLDKLSSNPEFQALKEN